MLDVGCSQQPGSFFCSCFFPNDSTIAYPIFLVHTVPQMLLTSRRVSRRKDVKQLSINMSKLKVGAKNSISRKQCFLLIPNQQRRQPVSLSLHLSELNYKTICLGNKDTDFIFLQNRLVYSAAPTMSSVAENHAIYLFYLLEEKFKNPLLDSLVTGRNFENLFYLSSCSLSQRQRFRRIRLNVLQGIESDLAYRKVSRVVSQYILRSGSLWHSLSSSMIKNN